MIAGGPGRVLLLVGLLLASGAIAAWGFSRISENDDNTQPSTATRYTPPQPGHTLTDVAALPALVLPSTTQTHTTSPSSPSTTPVTTTTGGGSSPPQEPSPLPNGTGSGSTRTEPPGSTRTEPTGTTKTTR